MNYPNRSVPNPNLVNEDKNISFANRGIDFEKAINMAPEKPSQLPMSINGRSYVFGIITDSRFKL